MQTPTPPGLNKQRVWSGASFHLPRPASQSPVGPRRSPTPHAGILASTSNSLFHPVPVYNIPSSHPYELRDIPPHPHNLWVRAIALRGKYESLYLETRMGWIQVTVFDVECQHG